MIVSNTVKNNYGAVKDKLKNHNVEFASTDEYIEKMASYEYVVAGREKYTKEMLENTKLKVISRCGHGTDAIDKTMANKLGIKVLDARGSLDETVADITIGYMIASLRRIVDIDRDTRSEGWKIILGNDLTGKTVGIIGLGGIGTAVAKRLKGFKTKTFFYDIAPDKQIEYPYANFVSKDYLLRNSDVITLHCDLNESSRNLINKDNLDKMKDGVIVINTASGEMVYLGALVEAAKDGKVGYAALDVYPEEPLPLSAEIRNSKNVLLGAHTACSSVEGQKKLAIKAIDNLLKEMGV